MISNIDELSEVFKPYAADFSLCEQTIFNHSKSFYHSFSQLPRQQAVSIFAIYSFCREADDSIDRYHDIQRLNQLKNELDQFLAGNIPKRYFWRALVPVFKTYEMNTQAFYDMLIGQEQDCYFEQPKTEEALYQYCYYVAGTVGLMILPILSEQASSFTQQAIQLGQAMQLTNILRDVGEDLDSQRIYLPQKNMHAFGITTEHLASRQVTVSFIQLWESIAKQAEELYAQGLTLLPAIDRECQEALVLSIVFYKELLNAVRQNNYQCFDTRNFVSETRRLELFEQAQKYLK